MTENNAAPEPKNWTNVFFALAVLFVVNWAYNFGQRNDLERANNSLRRENQSLKAENDELKFGAQRLFLSAKQGIASEAWTMAETNLQELLTRHPNASETAEAKVLLEKVMEERAKHAAILAEKLEQEEKARKAEEKALAAKAEEEKKEALAKQKKALQHMKTRTDKFEGITWFHDKSVNEASADSKVYIYFGRSGGNLVGPRFVVRYGGDEWLFVRRYKFKIDGSTIDFEPAGVKRDNSGGSVWEWSDDFVDNDIWPTVEKIADGKDVAIRFQGQQYYHDRVISAGEKTAVRRTLDAYFALKEGT